LIRNAFGLGGSESVPTLGPSGTTKGSRRARKRVASRINKAGAVRLLESRGIADESPFAGLGTVGIAWHREAHWPRAFLAAGVVQIATLHTMILGKNHFGRLRPQQVLESGDWTTT
jgi:hypothetical protein